MNLSIKTYRMRWKTDVKMVLKSRWSLTLSGLGHMFDWTVAIGSVSKPNDRLDNWNEESQHRFDWTAEIKSVSAFSTQNGGHWASVSNLTLRIFSHLSI